MARYIRARRLTVYQQRAGILAAWPGFHVAVAGTRLTARGRLRASPISEEYVVRIEYRVGGYPSLFVEEPSLERRPQTPDEPIPHTYFFTTPGREQPCTFYPPTDWNSTMPLARTVLPWLQCWLLDYECWRATGVWTGGGISHDGPKEPAEFVSE